MSLFPSIFCTISDFSLYGEYVVRIFLPNDVFIPCDHGLDFRYISLCENSLNQSTSQSTVTLRARELINPVSLPMPENSVSRDGCGSPAPRQPAHLHTQAESGAYLRNSSRVPRRRPFIYLKPPYAIVSVPNLSGHAIAYRWRSVSRSPQGLAKMMEVIVEVCRAFALTVSVKKAETMCMPPPRTPRTMVQVEAAGQSTNRCNPSPTFGAP